MNNATQANDHVGQVSVFLNMLGGYTKPRGVIHIGAHQGQEVDCYLEHGFGNVLLIEANPEWAAYLVEKFAGQPNIRVVSCAVADFDGSVGLQIHTSRSGSTEPASILALKKFKDIVKTLRTPHTITVPALRLDTLFNRHGLDLSAYNFLNIDVQGAEHLAFRGAPRVLRGLDAVLTEVNVVELYDGGAKEQDIERTLAEHDFARLDSVYHELFDETSRFLAWGESLFVKRNLLARAANSSPLPL